jgi:hypothetical protein
MADQQQLEILKQSPEAWNKWRKEILGVRPIDVDLRSAQLSDTEISK